MNCDKCMHSGVCKNEDGFREVESKFNADIIANDPKAKFGQALFPEFSQMTEGNENADQLRNRKAGKNGKSIRADFA